MNAAGSSHKMSRFVTGAMSEILPKCSAVSGMVNTMAPTELAVVALKKARIFRRGRESFCIRGQQPRIERAVQRTGDTKQARHGRKRELQTDARRGKRVGREQYGQRGQQRRRRIVLSPGAAAQRAAAPS